MPELKCACVSPTERYASRVMLAAIYGLAIALGYVLYAESILVVAGISAILMAVIFAPFVEEIFKSFPVLLGRNKNEVLLISVIASLSFGLGELLVSFIVFGTIVIAFTPIFHILFQLPMAFLYGRAVEKGKDVTKTFIAGYAIAVAFHALYNLLVLSEVF